MPGTEFLASIVDFVETGGNILLYIGLVAAIMWSMIAERSWYFMGEHRREVRRVRALWAARSDHSSWHAHKIRILLISQMRLKLTRGLTLIRTIVVVCPMLGLLGTVTGMIEVFDVMAISGSGNARAMAGGVSKATLPTMAGMVVALSGMIIAIQMDQFAKKETQRVADHLVTSLR